MLIVKNKITVIVHKRIKGETPCIDIICLSLHLDTKASYNAFIKMIISCILFVKLATIL